VGQSADKLSIEASPTVQADGAQAPASCEEMDAMADLLELHKCGLRVKWPRN
jgi:hypothetical protein